MPIFLLPQFAYTGTIELASHQQDDWSISVIRIVLVDIHPTLSRSVRRLLARDLEFKIVAEMSQSDQAVREFAGDPPDVVVLGMHPRRLEAVRTLAVGLPGTRLVVFGPGEGPQYARVSRALGASAFVCDTTAERDLPLAIRGEEAALVGLNVLATGTG